MQIIQVHEHYLIANKTIFLSALDWGLGHTTRCVALIRELEQNNTVILGCTPTSLPIFEREFPQLKKINLPPYEIRYSKVLPIWLKLLCDWPRIKAVIKKERQLLPNIIAENKINLIISDSRYGLFSKNTKSIFVSHQLFLKTPLLNRFAQAINKKYLLNFDEIWVPDHSQFQNSLSGELSHKPQFHPNVKFIGPLSRLKALTVTPQKKYDFLLLLSGPEPQQTLFAKLILQKLKSKPQQLAAVVIAKPNSLLNEALALNHPHIHLFVSPLAQQLSELISTSKKIICRSGYSTLMDLNNFSPEEVILVPTPGQTEQEYLAEFWKKKPGITMIMQKDIRKLNF